ncbi:helix-turn-helix domain-containing protein [Aureispira anguillae]|uniref:Helix-turn-helix domain-containing protein n=1 Tax=Aureispira anguillae TaxID=2864201 RepID=A0A915YGK7_9BACT|nr:helix-turn-helix transcriptional regulator [Aureispira anguillae]BDS12770.1 helix-turn-helix domain-containing protein [Aureispira anguillae]
MTIQERFKLFLEHKDKNPTQLAKEINVNQKTLDNLSKGKAKPSSTVLIPLAELGLNINWLLIGEGKMLDKNTSPTKNKEDKFTNDIEYVKRENELLKSQLKDKERIIELKDAMIKLLSKES